MKIRAIVQTSLLRAVWLALGVTLGGFILPRVLQPATHPPLTVAVILFAFAAVYLISFLVFLLIGWIGRKP